MRIFTGQSARILNHGIVKDIFKDMLSYMEKHFRKKIRKFDIMGKG